MKHKKIDRKIIFISGGAGSIGSNITEYLLKSYQPKVIRIFDNNEERLFFASKKYRNESRVRFMLGDVRDKARVHWALRDVETVFHTAAFKHVPLNEYNTFEAVKTNILGTQNLIESSLDNNIETFINISTDKAVNPSSVMGTTKLLTEKLTSSAQHYKGFNNTVFLSVRFGNVLNSSGSVIPVLLNQLREHVPLTVTDKRMIRYFMTFEEAIRLILRASIISIGGEIFILKMPKLKIIDLVKVLIEVYEKNHHGSYANVIEEEGKKSGEKYSEELLTEQESENGLETDDMYILPPDQKNRGYYEKTCQAKPCTALKDQAAVFMSRQKIKKIVLSLNLFK